ncbi:MAG TPA: hypothetical protein VL832_11435 [Puia sp.]|jgi:hypothetical protein|nr:hypothetical protein [Puia sp.]
MHTLIIWGAYWMGVSLLVLFAYILTVRGQFYCAAMFLGHVWATLKEEVCRPMRVIRKALSRKERKRQMHLDEIENSIS